jgi:hypothetical protein
MSNVYVPTQERLNEIRQIVKDKPEHPLRSELREGELRRANPAPMVTEMTVYALDGQWRVCYGAPTSKTYMDLAWGNSAAFEISNQRLLVTAPSPSAKKADYFGQIKSDFTHRLVAILTVEVGESTDRFGGKLPELAGTRWAFNHRRPLESGDGTITFQISGGWDPATNTGTIESFRSVIDRTDGSQRVWLAKAESFRYEPSIDLQLPRKVTRFHEDGRPDTIYELISIRKTSPEEMAKVLEVPSPNGTDAIRGKLQFAQIEDYRDSIAVPVAAGMPAPPNAAKKESSLRWLGWAAAGGLLVALVALRLRRGQGGP